jgi:hypothetical protein
LWRYVSGLIILSEFFFGRLKRGFAGPFFVNFTYAFA